MRERFEVINHKEAIYYVENLVKQHVSLSQWQIKSIHQLILKNIDYKNTGISTSYIVS